MSNPANDSTNRPSSRSSGPSALKVAIVLAPIAAIVVAGVWIGVNLVTAPPTPTPAPGVEARAPLETLDAVASAARSYMNEGSPQRAEAILASATHKYPNEQRLLAMHAECLLELGRHREAMEEFERACFVGPDSATYRDFAAVLAAQLGLDEKADTHWSVAQKLDPENPKYPLYRAQVQRRLGQNDAARMNLVLATRLDPSIGEAWATLAAIALDENRLGMVQQYIDRARTLDPENAYYRILEARGLRRAGRPEEAASLLYAIPEKKRLRDRGVLDELALCLGMMEEAQRAADMFVAASDAQPEDAELAYEAAVWLERAGRLEEARTMATRAKWLGSERAETLLTQLEGD